MSQKRPLGHPPGQTETEKYVVSYRSEQEYTTHALRMAAEGWMVGDSVRHEDGSGTVTWTRPFTLSPPPQVSPGYMSSSQVPVEAIVARVRTSIPDFVRRTIQRDEQILAAFNASLFDHRRPGEFRHDRFMLTTERIIYYHTAIIHKGMGEMPYRMLTGVQYNRGFIHGKVIVEAANAGLTMDGIRNDDAAFAEKIIAGSIAGRKYRVV